MTPLKIKLGDSFNRWTVIDLNLRCDDRPAVRVKCSCGTTTVVRVSVLRSGASASCGCLRAEVASKTMTTHGKKGTPEYDTWCSMKQRCYDTNCKSYPQYGGRGITICESWINSFENFFTDMGIRPT